MREFNFKHNRIEIRKIYLQKNIVVEIIPMIAQSEPVNPPNFA